MSIYPSHLVDLSFQSKSKVKLELDCSRRRGNVSHTGSLTATMTVPPQTALVGHPLFQMSNSHRKNMQKLIIVFHKTLLSTIFPVIYLSDVFLSVTVFNLELSNLSNHAAYDFIRKIFKCCSKSSY